MKVHFIKNIQIKDFKCFDDFKADGFARVNLIGGKNNVGKTAFMEACHVNLSAKDVKTLSTALIATKYRRERVNTTSADEKNVLSYLEETSNIYVSSNNNKVFFKVVEGEGIKEYEFSIGKKTTTINVNDFTLQVEGEKNTLFMSSLGSSSAALIKRYSSLQKRDKEEYLNTILRKVDSRIESFKVIEDIPQCKINSKYIEITNMGDGIRHLISIVSSLYASENGYLFIDEIGNGIHYTLLDDVWKIILALTKELNVQVFATTHSKECIESFSRVQLEREDQSSSYFELAKEKETNNIFMSALPPSQLEYELSHEGKFRGE